MVVYLQARALVDKEAADKNQMAYVDGRPVYPSLCDFYERYCLGCKYSSLDCALRTVHVMWDPMEPLETRVYLLGCDKRVAL